ncbi:MAG: ABC transporter permease, partial [Coriobacteriaceae bacterium]|nr:ABC transporter permease [Coriobacteriaceae bacterium]
GLVLAFMIYTLVVAFGNLGKAIAVLLLIVQVTACGGSYPLQMLPDFVQAISPWVPATYIVDLLRAAMMGVYQNDFWISMGYLALFIIPFLLLGLALRKPMERFMKFYVSKVEECKIME